MFKQNKISKFIEKYGWELSENNFDELEVFLNKINRFPSIIRKIEKLSNRKQEYVLTTINNYKKYGFTEEDLELVLNAKLNYIKNYGKENFNNIEFDHIYYAFKPNREFFEYFISEYYKSKENSTNDITLGSYYSVINKNYKEFNQVFKKAIDSENYDELNNYIYSLSPRFLCLFFEYTKENKIPTDIQARFFDYVSTKDRMFDMPSIRDFNDILEFIFKCEDKTNQRDILDRKLVIVKHFRNDLKNNWCYLNALGNLSDNYILGIFKEKDILYDSNFLSLLKDSDNQTKNAVTYFIKNMDSHYNDYYYKILNSEVFNKIGYSTIEFILKEIENIKDEKAVILKEKVNIIMNLAILDNEEIIKKTLNFVKNDSDIKLVSTKINCIKNIIPSVYSKEVSIDGYGRYLELLSDGLENKSVDDQIDILEAKANFFEKTNSYSNVGKISKRAIQLLDEEENRTRDVYSFVSSTSSNYDSVIVEKIVEGLSNLKTYRDKETFIDFVVDEFFVESRKERQETLLGLFESKEVIVDFCENEEGFVQVSPYIHSVVEKSNKPMEFVNKETGLKIFVKTNKKD